MQQKHIFIIANWKMYLSVAESKASAEALVYMSLPVSDAATIVVCPSFPALEAVADVLCEKSSRVFLGAQDVFWENGGAFTGEVGPRMLAELGCRYIIIGHSERRQHKGETDEMIAKKVAATYETGLQPILCIGETLKQREQGNVEAVLTRQLTEDLAEVENKTVPVIVAYEPRWAIGTGNPVEPSEAERVAQCVADQVDRLGFSKSYAHILYGGSVVPENAARFCEQPSIAGVLIGGASAKPDQLSKIIQNLCG